MVWPVVRVDSGDEQGDDPCFDATLHEVTENDEVVRVIAAAGHLRDLVEDVFGELSIGRTAKCDVEVGRSDEREHLSFSPGVLDHVGRTEDARLEGELRRCDFDDLGTPGNLMDQESLEGCTDGDVPVESGTDVVVANVVGVNHGVASHERVGDCRCQGSTIKEDMNKL